MMTIEEFLKEEILKKHKNIKAFCTATSIPYMTVLNVLNRGIDNSSFSTIQRICDGLHMSIAFFLTSYKSKIGENVKFEEAIEALHICTVTTERFLNNTPNIDASDISLILSFWDALNMTLIFKGNIPPSTLQSSLNQTIEQYSPDN